MQFGRTLNKFVVGTQKLIPALRLVWQSSPAWTVAKLSLLFVQGLLPLASIYLVKLLVDALTEGLALAEPQQIMRQISPLLVGVVFVVLITMVSCS